MNYKKFFNKSVLMIALAMVGLLAALLVPQRAQGADYSLAPQEPNFYRLDTNACPITLVSGQSSTNYTAGSTNSLRLTVRQDKGLSVFPQFTCYNAGGAVTGGATNLTFAYTVTYDGVKWVTGTAPLIQTVPNICAATTTNGQMGWTNWSAPVLSNVRQIQLVGVTNNGPWVGQIVVTGLAYSYSGQ
jgi:hypothetical protein